MELPQTAMPPYPWQKQIWSNFCDTAKSQKLPHAILFDGPAGVGVEKLTLAAARYLLCLSPLDDVACGRCRSCSLLNSGANPDLLVIGLEEGATQIKVDQVRRCVEFDAKTSHFEVHKVIVVMAAESMNVNAANALLKNLEEPIGKTRFLLSCENVDSLLPTIRSRCQRVSTSLPSLHEALEWIGETEFSSEQLQTWFSRFGGAPVAVKNALSAGVVEALSQFAHGLSQMATHQRGAISVSADWKKLDVDTLFSVQFWVLEELIRATMLKESVNTDLAALTDVLPSLMPKRIFAYREKLLGRLSQWRSQSNPNVALLVEEMALDWQVLLKAG